MKRLAFVALALVLGLGTLELGSRLVEPLLQSSPRTHPVYGSDDPRFLVLDPECGYRLRAHSEGTYLARTGARRPYRINGIGCADGELQGDGTRVEALFLGDSCTFGEGLEGSEPAYHQLLESRLRPGVPESNFLNAGIPGYSSPKALAWYRRDLARLRPRVVVIWIGWNDRWWAQNDPDWIRQFASLSQSGDTLMGQSALIRVMQTILTPISRRWHHAQFARNRPPWRPICEPIQFRENLLSLIRICQEGGSIPILMTQMSGARRLKDVPEWMIEGGALPDYKLFFTLLDAYNQMIRDVARKRDLTLVDLDVSLKSQSASALFDRPNLDPVHPNAAGHRAIADLLEPILRKLLYGNESQGDDGPLLKNKVTDPTRSPR